MADTTAIITTEDKVRAIVGGRHIDYTGSENWVSPLMRASGFEDQDVVRRMLEMGADVKVVNVNGWTALMWAVNEGRIDNVIVLLEHRPFQDLHVLGKSGKGKTSAYKLARSWQPEILKILDSHTERANRTIIDMAFNYRLNKPAIDALLLTEEYKECSICLEALRFGKERRLACRHGFHETCIGIWNACDGQSSQKCPICRTPIKRLVA